MRGEVKALVDAVLDEADNLDDLVDVLREQRETMKARDAEEVDALMREMREILFDVQTRESLRDDLAKKLAAQLGGEPRVSVLRSLMEEDERALFNGAAERLSHSVFTLKSEIAILSGLIDQNERYTSMLLSEWRRLVGDVSQAGATDFRG